jgi:alpha-ketoglutarate-dependent sulfate ester dioxygenase
MMKRTLLILRGDIVPPYGGDTQFTNLVAAYNALSPVMRTFVDGLRGVHRFAPPPGVDETPEYRELMRKRTLESEHPIVRVHPESGERALFVSPSFLKSIVGLSARESQVLLEFLWEHVVRPEFTLGLTKVSDRLGHAAQAAVHHGRARA